LLTRLLVLASGLVGLLAFTFPHLPPADTWWMLAAGRWIWEQGRLPAQDPFSWTAAGSPWLDHEWLAQVVFYGLYLAGGLPALFALRSLAVLAAFGLLPFGSARRRGLSEGAVVACLLLCTALSEWRSFFDVRAYLFTYLGLSATLFLLVEYLEEGQVRWLWPLPALTALWANLHGGFILAPGLLLVAAWGCLAGRQGRRAGALALVALACLAAALLNPYGLELLAFPFSLAGRSAFSLGLNEWAPPEVVRFSPHPLPGPQAGFLLLALAALVRLARPGPGLPQRLWTAVFVVGGLLWWRHIPLACLALAYVLPRWLPGVRLPARAALAAWGGILAAGIWLLLGQARGGPAAWTMERRLFPVEAAEFLRLNPGLPRRLYNPYEWGGYLAWRLYPAWQVFIDGRAHTVYSERLYAQALLVQFGPAWRQRLESQGVRVLGNQDWREVLDEYGVQTVLGTRLQGDLCRRLQEASGWFSVYSDPVSCIFLRDTPANRSLALGLRYPATAWGHLARAQVALAAGREAEALAQARRALSLDPSEAAAHRLAGILLLRAGRAREGVAHLQKALALDADLPDVHYNLGLYYLQLGQLERARTHFRRELEIHPGHPGARSHLP
jgi:tetratricopeptide (TPR) repeat protein